MHRRNNRIQRDLAGGYLSSLSVTPLIVLDRPSIGFRTRRIDERIQALSGPQLSSAAAVLSVAACSPSSIVAFLPARCYVADEAVLIRALTHALSQLPSVPE
jgi:hypothetical protein